MGVLGFFGIVALLIFSIAAVVILSMVFWVCMLIYCATREFKNSNDKVVWILIIILLHFLGALIYWGVVKKSDATSAPK